jgi:putative ABC transport system permease protein
MLKNYLTIAWRQIRNHPLYTLIHVLGLSMGLTACIVIWLVTRYDLGFDRFHPHGDRVYRIVGVQSMTDGRQLFANCIGIAELEHRLPGVEGEETFHFFPEQVTVPADGVRRAVVYDGKQPDGFAGTTILTGPNFFTLFPHRWLVGNPAVLNEPGRVVLSESAARKYFGPGAPDGMIGRRLIYSDSVAVTVSGIVADWSHATDLAYTDFISINTPVQGRPVLPGWRGVSPDHSQIFIRLDEKTPPERVNAVFKAYLAQHPPALLFGASGLRVFLQPLADMHYTPDTHRQDDGDPFRKAYKPLLYALIGVAGFILVLALINFINLSTALSLQRMKEVGIRKVMGGSRRGLTGQFLVETLLMTVCAGILSLLLAGPVLRLFSEYIPSGVTYSLLDGGNWAFLFCITIFTTLAAGFYPARVLSSYKPVLSLKGAGTQGPGSTGLRRLLIVFQFTISLVFIIGALVIGRQISFMRHADKGFDSDAVVTVIGGPRSGAGQMKVFAEAVRGLPGVREVIGESNSPMGYRHTQGSFLYRGKQVDTIFGFVQGADESFLPFYKLQLLAGRNLLSGDSVREAVVNESCIRAMGVSAPEEALGKPLYDHRGRAYTVCGVVRDFHEESFHEAIRPVFVLNAAAGLNETAIRLASQGRSAEQVQATLTKISAVWKGIFPEDPINYVFLNEAITQLYDQEMHTAWLMDVAMGIALAISCMGLFGLALFTAGRRAKEIGIRKVLGATVANVVVMLSRDFLALVGFAFLIAAPVAWYFAAGWLRDFAYRAPMNAWVLAEAGVGAMGLALLTVGWQALRAALTNPVESLRRE